MENNPRNNNKLIAFLAPDFAEFVGEGFDHIVQLRNDEKPITELKNYNPNEYYNLKNTNLDTTK